MGDVVLSSILSDAKELVADESCKAYEILFQDYVAYSVRNESFVSVDESEQWTGRLFQTYSRSHFLDYVRVATFASDDHPGKLGHYGINCLNHIVDVVSASQPIISLIRRAQQLVVPLTTWPRELPRGFVHMQYLGYLRRNPNDLPEGISSLG